MEACFASKQLFYWNSHILFGKGVIYDKKFSTIQSGLPNQITAWFHGKVLKGLALFIELWSTVIIMVMKMVVVVVMVVVTFTTSLLIY